jgi:hypothetical protein
MSAPGVGAVTGPASQTGSNQGRPDFSGTWQAIYSGPPEPFRPGLRPQVNWGNVVTLTQDTTSLTVEYVSYGRSHARVKLVYRLDGTANMNIDAASVAPQERHTTAGWEGPSLVLTATVDWPDGTGRTTPRVTREVLSLESPDVLRLETRLTFRGEAATATVRYRRR